MMYITATQVVVFTLLVLSSQRAPAEPSQIINWNKDEEVCFSADLASYFSCSSF